MNKFFQFLAVAVLSISTAVAQNKWSVDPAHTNVRFDVKHLGISFVDGEFTKLSGSVDAPTATTFNNSKIDFTIDANSINTRIEMRDNHLKSDDFFAVAKYPTITLKSVSFKPGKKGQFTMLADLTLRGVTKRVTFNVIQNGGIITDPWGKTRAGFTATTTINRHDFGLNYNDKLPSGVEAVASDVTISVNTELVKN